MSTVAPEPDGTETSEPGVQSEARPTIIPLSREHRALATTSKRTEQLVAITAALAEAVAPEQVFQAVVEQVANALGASSAGLFQVHEAERTVELVHAIGYSEASASSLRSVPLDLDPSFPALETIRTRAPLWFTSQQELVAKYPHLHDMVSPGRSYQVACLPIVVGRRTLGAIALTFDDSPPLDQEQKDFLLLVARYCAQALERLRMLALERAERARAELAAGRAGVLSSASRAFSEAGDNLSTVLQTVVEQVTELHAEFCGVSLISGEHLELKAMHHRDPEAKRLLREAVQEAPVKLEDSQSGQVIATGQSLYIAKLDPDVVAAARPEHRRWLERYNPGSVIIAPLRVPARIIGTLTAVRHSASVPFTQDDVRFLEELGERAAMAIESSRLYQDSLQSRSRAELLYGLVRTVIEAVDEQQVFESAMAALEQALHAPRSAILIFDRDGVMRFRAWRGLSDEYRTAVEGHSPWTQGEHDPRHIFISDVSCDQRTSQLRAVLEAEHIGALGFFPLSAAGQLVGKFMVYYDAPRKLSHQETEMAGAIANHVAAAVSRFAAVASLQQTVKFNEMFTGMLGHDLRNPLGAIMTSAQVAVRRATDERMTKPLGRIITSGQRMARMIDQLLDFTRVRVGRGMPMEPGPVDLVHLMKQVIDELDGALPGRLVKFTHQGDANGAWDADRLSQVFSNLIANALQHGEPEFGVSVSADGSMPDWVTIHVHNLGAIPDAVMPNLFEPMTGADHRRHRSDGLGLGLYISHQIVKAHGGSIQATSSVACGTTFMVVLPRESGNMPSSERV